MAEVEGAAATIHPSSSRSSCTNRDEKERKKREGLSGGKERQFFLLALRYFRIARSLLLSDHARLFGNAFEF